MRPARSTARPPPRRRRHPGGKSRSHPPRAPAAGEDRDRSRPRARAGRSPPPAPSTISGAVRARSRLHATAWLRALPTLGGCLSPTVTPPRPAPGFPLRVGYGFFPPWRAAFTRRLRTRAHAQGVSTHLRPETTEPAPTGHAPLRPTGPRPPSAAGPLTPLNPLSPGPAPPTAQRQHKRLGKPTALAVFGSDNLSSVAYATEE